MLISSLYFYERYAYYYYIFSSPCKYYPNLKRKKKKASKYRVPHVLDIMLWTVSDRIQMLYLNSDCQGSPGRLLVLYTVSAYSIDRMHCYSSEWKK